VFNFSSASTWLQVVTWLAYVIPVMTLFLLPQRTAAPAAAAHARRSPARVSRPISEK